MASAAAAPEELPGRFAAAFLVPPPLGHHRQRRAQAACRMLEKKRKPDKSDGCGLERLNLAAIQSCRRKWD